MHEQALSPTMLACSAGPRIDFPLCSSKLSSWMLLESHQSHQAHVTLTQTAQISSATVPVADNVVMPKCTFTTLTHLALDGCTTLMALGNLRSLIRASPRTWRASYDLQPPFFCYVVSRCSLHCPRSWSYDLGVSLFAVSDARAEWSTFAMGLVLSILLAIGMWFFRRVLGPSMKED